MKEKWKGKRSIILNICLKLLLLKKARYEECNSFFWYSLNATVCEFSNFKIGTVNAIRKKFVRLNNNILTSLGWTKWASDIKVPFYYRYCSKIILTSAFICFQSCFLLEDGKKAMNLYIVLLHMFLLLKETSS